jgi:glycosyltransferase involved in cell wall biosynthesis
VFLGGRGAADAEVERRIVELGLEHRVVRPGRVPDADRDALLMMADALVFPSIYEGFGAPVIEAMALGTPVICGDHPALREVVADAAVVVPNDVDAWGAALATARRTRLELIAAGLERVSRFDLAASATALVAAYERTAAA